MNQRYGQIHFRSKPFNDTEKGCAGIELLIITEGSCESFGRVIFWDATGQLLLETSNTEVPLDILEELIAEAKAFVKID